MTFSFEVIRPDDLLCLHMEARNLRLDRPQGQSPALVDLPDFAAEAIAYLGFLPGAPLTRDQWLMLQRDNLPAKGAPGLEAFGIKPTPLGAVAHEWLGRFHKGGRFAGRRVNLTATS